MSQYKICAIVVCAVPLLPAALAQKSHWIRIQSANFEVFTTAGERDGRDLARYFEQIRGFFLEAMDLGIKSGQPVRIVLFRSDKEYRTYAPNEIASAFYLGSEDHDYIVMKGSAAEESTAVHEYVHLLVKHTGLDPPPWFNEGLAELYSNLRPLGDQIQVGRVILPHLARLRQSKWIDLQTLLDVRRDSPLYTEKDRVGVFYAESWALVHMLYLAPEYRPRLHALLDGIQNDVDVSSLFQQVYQKSVSQVEQDLHAYMNGTRFAASLYHVKLAKSVDAPVVAPSSGLDAGLLLAEMLSNTYDRSAAAHDVYARLSREYPKDWRVEEGVARLDARDGNPTEALRHFARADALGATNPRMYLEYGQLLRAHGKLPDAGTALKKATEVDPGFSQARIELAILYLGDNQHAEALEQLQKVKHVTPDQAYEFYYNLAYANYRMARQADARQALASCRKYAKTPARTFQVDGLAAALEKRPPVAQPAALEPPPPPKPVPPRPSWPAAEGDLKEMVCVGAKIQMRITVGPKVMSFLILNPASVIVKNEQNTPVDFSCGQQNPRRVRVEYEPKPDVALGTVGVVQVLEFPQ